VASFQRSRLPRPRLFVRPVGGVGVVVIVVVVGVGACEVEVLWVLVGVRRGIDWGWLAVPVFRRVAVLDA